MPALLVAAPHKSSGKTTLTLGLCAAFAARGLRVQPFKKGPDYIDPMWLALASGQSCYNLDFNTMSHAELEHLYARHAHPADLTLVEGNMGLFDSLSASGGESNADLAKLLGMPVLLVVDAHGATRSLAALVKGFVEFDPELRIAGVLLNKVAGARHAERLREVFSLYHPDLPLLGLVPRDGRVGMEERHLGLVPSNEAREVADSLSAIRDHVAAHIDLDRVLSVARQARSIPAVETPPIPRADVRIAIAQDEAFGFYYPDDLEALRRAGAELVPVDLQHTARLPEVDGLFIGGGFPETRMAELEANSGLRRQIAAAIEAGLPCYAECGGLMYLCRSIRWHAASHQMVGVIPADVVMHQRPVGRGYIRLEETPVHPWPGALGDGAGGFRAHEFHHSSLENLPEGTQFAYRVRRGSGIDGQYDGIVYRNLLAGYTHLRDTQGNHWAERFVRFVRRHARTTT